MNTGSHRDLDVIRSNTTVPRRQPVRQWNHQTATLHDSKGSPQDGQQKPCRCPGRVVLRFADRLPSLGLASCATQE
jgi:hypothetical protein